MGNSQTLPRSDELSVKIDKGDFLLDKLGAGRPNCARETGMSCNELPNKAFAGLPQNFLPHETESSSLWSFRPRCGHVGNKPRNPFCIGSSKAKEPELPKLLMLG